MNKPELDDLLPCPFCGSTPDLPTGDGTHYEIECDCGMAISSVQICDLMSIDERTSADFTNYRYPGEFIRRANLEAVSAWNERHEADRAADKARIAELEQCMKYARTVMSVTAQSESISHVCHRSLTDEIARIDATLAKHGAKQ